MTIEYRKIFKHSIVPMLLLDRQGTYLDHNDAFSELMGYDQSNELPVYLPEDVSPEFQPDGTKSVDQVKVYNQLAYQEGACDFPWLHKKVDGSLFLSRVHLDWVTFEDEGCILVSLSDLNEDNKIKRLVAEESGAIMEENRFLSSMINNKLVGLMVTNDVREIVMVNDRMLEILNYQETSELVGKETRLLYGSDSDYNRFAILYQQAYEEGETFNIEFQFVDKKGQGIWCDVAGSALDNHCPPDLSKGVLWVVEDISDRKRITKELEDQYLLAKDANPLTGLPGNNTIKSRLKQSVDYQMPHGVMYVDIDNFKSYNDKYGFVKGDDVLKATARILTQVGRDLALACFFVGNIGGDDFVMIVDDRSMAKVADLVIERFDASIKSYYSNSDVSKGEITSKDREGNIKSFPIMGISIAGVALKDVRGLNYIEVIDICTELKHEAKLEVSSSAVFNRRQIY